MFWYVRFTRGVYGRAHVNHRTALNKMDLLYCAYRYYRYMHEHTYMKKLQGVLRR